MQGFFLFEEKNAILFTVKRGIPVHARIKNIFLGGWGLQLCKFARGGGVGGRGPRHICLAILKCYAAMIRLSEAK